MNLKCATHLNTKTNLEIVEYVFLTKFTTLEPANFAIMDYNQMFTRDNAFQYNNVDKIKNETQVVNASAYKGMTLVQLVVYVCQERIAQEALDNLKIHQLENVAYVK